MPENDGSAYIARYALGRDYHKTVRRRLARLARRISARVAGGSYRAFADSAPVLEKPLADKAGIGWVGKNTLVLNEDAGSMFFLGEIYTNIPLPVSGATARDSCGGCKACINVCPTGAILGPRRLDARKCISYLTIEHKGAIPVELREAVGNRVFGCDDCQIVCPWNRYAKRTAESDFAPRHGLDAASLAELLSWDEAMFSAKTEGMALRRVNYRAMGSQPRRRGGECALRQRSWSASCASRRVDADEMVTEHIDWALARQASRKATGNAAQFKADSEEPLPVEPEFVDRLANVFQRAVRVVLPQLRDKLRMPAKSEFLDARHVDDAIVQEVGDLRHVPGEEAPVLPYRVSAQRRRAPCRMPLEKIQRLRLGLDESHPVLPHPVDQPEAVWCSVFQSSMPASAASGCEMGSTGPSAIALSSLSVTIVATSRMTSTSGVEAGHLHIHPDKVRRHASRLMG